MLGGLRSLRETAAEKELEALLNGEADGNDTFLEINAGAGGTESCDWASMLARMYTRYAEHKGWKVEMISYNESDLGGYKDVQVDVTNDLTASGVWLVGGARCELRGVGGVAARRRPFGVPRLSAGQQARRRAARHVHALLRKGVRIADGSAPRIQPRYALVRSTHGVGRAP